LQYIKKLGKEEHSKVSNKQQNLLIVQRNLGIIHTITRGEDMHKKLLREEMHKLNRWKKKYPKKYRREEKKLRRLVRGY
jgi:hypothetical protein